MFAKILAEPGRMALKTVSLKRSVLSLSVPGPMTGPSSVREEKQNSLAEEQLEPWLP